MPAPRVFVSHSHRDNTFTSKLVAELRAAGARVWVDIADLKDSDFMERINGALASSDWVILVLTPHSVASAAVRMEINAALNLVIQKRLRAVIPIIATRTDEREIPPTWSTLHRYDATADYDEALSSLLHVLGLEPTPAPAAPKDVPFLGADATIGSTPIKAGSSRNRLMQTIVPIVVTALIVSVFATVLYETALRNLGGSSRNTTDPFTTASITCPSGATTSSWHLMHSGQLTVVTDPTYAPLEFTDPHDPGQYSGLDMDLARELGHHLCLSPTIVKADFGAIVPSLSSAQAAPQYDLGMSGITINAARQQLVDLVPYMQFGESILVLSNNPAGISSIRDMCGHGVSVQSGTLEEDELKDANGTGPGDTGQAPVCKGNPITISRQDATDAVVNSVLAQVVSAAYLDQPVTDYYVSLHKDQIFESGIPVPRFKTGIAISKSNTSLETSLKQALADMQQDGSYARIFTKWGLQDLTVS